MVHSLHDISPIFIRLPNGNFSVAKQIGTICFSLSFFLTNVLYVPNFSLNLISVAKLCYALPSLLSFINLQCLVQDPRSLKTISSAELIEELYHLVLPD